MFNFDFKLLLIQAPVILFSLSIHEFAHAYVAHLLGDDTAKRLGRLTLNPLRHLEPFGTILIFLVGFGWARPVPVNMLNFKNPRRGMLLVALAGPVSNLLTAVLAGVVLRNIPPEIAASGGASSIYTVCMTTIFFTIQLGVALAVFNMIPLPPLDGSRVLYGILPERYAYSYSRIEPYGIMILMFLFIFGSHVFAFILWKPVSILTRLIAG